MVAVIGEPGRLDDAETLLTAVAAWGRRRPDVHAILLVGSHARTELPADRWKMAVIPSVDGRRQIPAGPATLTGGEFQRQGPALDDTGSS
jgi:hypothetical protein